VDPDDVDFFGTVVFCYFYCLKDCVSGSDYVVYDYYIFS